MRGLGGLAQLLLGALAMGTMILPGTLTASPVETIRNAEMLLVPAVLTVYSLLAESCSFWRALGRALVSIPSGAAAIAFFAIALGAPIGFHADTARRTLHWSLFMSTLMIAPASAVLGPSWSEWQRIFAFTRPKGKLELSICLPAHGAAIGAWLGAFPMPLDWDREWQQWPVSCTYGAVFGYFLASVASFIWFRLAPRAPKLD